MKDKKRLVFTTGKRKTSIAKAIFKPGKGRVTVNSVSIEVLEPEFAREKIMEPIILAGDKIGGVDIKVGVKGGGVTGQAEASRMSIARGILEYTKDDALRKAYTKYDRTMIAGDPRRSEPKKFGGPSSRTKRQKSYR